MHDIQRKLLSYAKETSLYGKTLREIGDAVGEGHPQKVKHHLEQLISKGLLQRDRDGNLNVVTQDETSDKNLISVPIVGAANCGPAQAIAEEDIEGYLRMSPTLAHKNHRVFAVRAIGNSMNQASINNSSVNEGDYLLVDCDDQVSNGDYVLSVIDGLANVKRFYRDDAQHQIVLVSESSQKIPPIIIDPNALSYFLNGKVIRVIKPPKSYA